MTQATNANVRVATNAPAAGYRLQDRLPTEVLVGGDAMWNRYREYPVFSLRWLLGRMRVFAVALSAFALMTFLGLALGEGNIRAGLLSGGYLFLAFMLMSTLGPAMATLVRHRRWPESRERAGVVLAWLAGIVLAFFIDRWASANVNAIVDGMLADSTLVAQAKEQAALRSAPLRMAILAVNVVVLLAIYGFLGGGLALRAYFSERRRWEEHRHGRELEALRAEKRATDLRLGVLQAQVEPHFLFNTLASVRALVRREPERAEKTLDALVAHLRATIPKLRDGDALLQSTLGQQLDICASYLEVMRLRTGDRLSWSIDADPALRALPYPPLLLITLVENAVKHGIEPRRGPGRIDLRAARRDGTLSVSVVDDGVGLRQGAGSGMGLANVRAQLEARFGARASLRLCGREDAGTLAEIATPLEDRA